LYLLDTSPNNKKVAKAPNLSSIEYGELDNHVEKMHLRRYVQEVCVETLVLKHEERPIPLAKSSLGRMPQTKYGAYEMDSKVSVSCYDFNLTSSEKEMKI
jgi:hypothetical protein